MDDDADSGEGRATQRTVVAAHGHRVFERLPPGMVDTLSLEQKDAIGEALVEPAWNDHAINIRLFIPFFGRRFYVTLVGGESRRDRVRLQSDRRRYPLRTVANIAFIFGVGALVMALTLVGLALASAVIQF